MSTEAPDDLFVPAVVDAVAKHMNDDHAEDSVAICQGLGGVADAVAAVFVGMDGVGAQFTATTAAGEERALTVPWVTTPTTRVEIRHEIVRMYEAARDALGLPPEDRGEH